MRAQRLEGFLRAVAGGGQAVRAEAHPGEDGDEGELVEETMIRQVAGTTDQEGFEQSR